MTTLAIMQLAILTAVLAALAAAECGGPPVAAVGWRLLVVGSAVLLAPLAALVGTQRLVQSLARNAAAEASVSRLESIVIGLWLAAVAIVLFVARWPQIVNSNWQLAAWPLAGELAILTPVIVPLVLVWAALYRLERSVQVAACHARQINPPPARLLAHLWLNARHQLGLVLVPPLAIVGGMETAAAIGFQPDHWDGAWWVAVPLVGTTLVLMPMFVRRMWRTSPLPAGALRDLLIGICRRRNCALRGILIWHTDFTLANAAVVGLWGPLRYMLLSDALVTRLSAGEIAAVTRHEVAHLRRWHLPLRLALLVLPLACGLVIKAQWPSVELNVESFVTWLGLPADNVMPILAAVAMLLYALLVVGSYSRLLEHDADLDACLTDGGQFDPEAADDFCRALTTLCGRTPESRWTQWLHPTLVARLRFVRDVAVDPVHCRVFRRQLKWITAAIVGSYVAIGAAAAF